MDNVENKKQSNSGIRISVRSFLVSTIIIFALWIGVYIATFFIPSGEYVRDASGVIDINSYHSVTRDFPFWKFILSPFLLFGSSDALSIIEIIIFLFIVSAAMNSLTKSGIMKYSIDKIAFKFGKRKYVCLAIIMLIFMLMGSFVGSFEEIVPFIPVMVGLAISFGWDTFTGIAMSLVADACGFAAGVMNPFTVGVAEKLCGLQMFNAQGILLRLIAFILIYALLLGFMLLYVRRLDKKNANLKKNEEQTTFVRDEKLDKASLSFLIIMVSTIALVIISSFIPVIQDYSIIIMTLGFLVSGIVCPLIAKHSGKEIAKNFGGGVIGMAPAVVMILLASSIKYILVETKTLDTILKFFFDTTSGLQPIVVLIFIYLIVLVFNFFIPSGSAKAFLIIPLVAPLAKLNNIPLELCVLAFAFGDGFSNVLYPTNPVLLIGINMVDMSYSKYLKKISLFQLAILALTMGYLVIAFLIL